MRNTSGPQVHGFRIFGYLWTMALAACGDLSPSLVVGETRFDAGQALVVDSEPDLSVPDLGTRDRGAAPDLPREPEVDLVVVGVEGLPTTLRPGEALELVILVENQGLDPSPTTFAIAELVPIGALENNPAQETGSSGVDGLQPRDLKDLVITGRVPVRQPPGRYQMWVTVDPRNNVVETSTANNRLMAGVVDISDLRIAPTRLDFGVVGPGCSAVRSVSAVNEGDRKTFIRRVELQRGVDAFFNLAAPPPLPLAVDPDAIANIDVVFSPQREGSNFRARLDLEHDSFIGLQTVEVLGASAVEPYREDVLYQRPGPKMDAVFVVQSGCRSTPCPLLREQQELAFGFKLFFLTQVRTRNADWRVLVTSTDGSPGQLGALLGPVLTSTHPDVARAFERQVRAGDSGSGVIAGFAATEDVLQKRIRADAGVVVIILGLHDDFSNQALETADYWVHQMRQALGPERSLVINGFIPPLEGCEEGFSFTPRYDEAIRLTGGNASSACNEDEFRALINFGPPGLGLATRFPLSQGLAREDTLEVEVNDVPILSFDQAEGTENWRYEPGTESVVFTGFLVKPSAKVVLRYRSRC